KLSLSSTRADGNKGEKPPQKNPSPGKAHKGGGTEDNSQSVDNTKPVSPNKEEILAVFKRIQASISKGESLTSKKSASKIEEDKPSAEAMLEALFQSRTPGKGKTISKKWSKSPSPQKDSRKREKTAEESSKMSLESPPSPLPPPSDFSRQPSNFVRKSPIPLVSRPRDTVGAKSETLISTNGKVEMESKKLEEMNVAELKEVAKSKGIKGYSKLKKSELIELLIRS
ncbi:SAP-like protein BP-73, partial [Dorcoceras hygrometricum]